MLKKLKHLFSDFEKNKIDYVIWKSLENIDKALAGFDDIDIIFNQEQYNQICQSLRKHNFVEDMGSPGNVGSDLKVFRGFDRDSGAFIMLHAHFKCRFGSKKYKEFRFHYEDEMLENVEIYHGAKILNDVYFIITRVLIATVKTDKPDPYIYALANKFFSLDEKERKIVINRLSAYYGDGALFVLNELRKNNREILKKYHNLVLSKIIQISRIKKSLLCLKLFANRIINLFLRRIFKRNKIGFGADIVLAGGDGAGKTSVAFRLQSVLGKAAVTKKIYLGRNHWTMLNDKINKLRMRKPFLPLNYLWPITSTIELVFRYFKGKILKMRKEIVIYDRSLDDVLIKYKNVKFSVSWFPKIVIKLINKKGVNLKYLLIADPEIIVKRDKKHTFNEVKKRQDDCLSALKERYKIINTGNISIGEVSAGIIEDTFSFAAKKQA